MHKEGVEAVQRPRILVVDDDQSMAYLMAAMASSCHCEVKIATAGTDAVRIAEEWRPEVVLLDLMMPGMDGFEVAARLRADMTTKIVAVTALSKNDERVQGADFDHFLVKPILKETVTQVIRQLTSRSCR
jgi:CheY-like chemotaxis protein